MIRNTEGFLLLSLQERKRLFPFARRHSGHLMVITVPGLINQVVVVVVVVDHGLDLASRHQPLYASVCSLTSVTAASLHAGAHAQHKHTATKRNPG